MSFLYLLGIKLFHGLVLFASIFNAKAKLWINGRKNIFEDLSQKIQSDDKIAWFHCASLGEFEQGRPLIEELKRKHTEYKILLTFFSPSGYEIRKNYENADYICYLPLDTPKNAKQFLNIVNPQLIFFIKYEFWYFFLREIWKQKIPLYLVSGIFRRNQRFFKKHAVQSRKMLTWFTHFFVQNEDSKQLLNSINIQNVSVTGDTRFDRVFTITQQSKKLPIIEKFAKNNMVLIAGSTWKPDEEIIIKFFNESNKQLKLIIAPHETHKENINRIIGLFSDKKLVKCYSETNEDEVSNYNVLIIDSIGILSSIYKYGQIAYIGGGFGKGIHNILEAATFGMPIIFGTEFRKFQEAIDLIKLGGAASISNFEDFQNVINTYFENNQKILQMGNVCSKYVNEMKGATNKILNEVYVK
ncbi:MAG: 3-deoxy-D-manno-octulosonic acid transferase [Bacteroidales bacterium]|jgi:3-deoxy-D-manno-octulosonic-acid transferase|nr:3-deoxy-D-manno-octulosonic acid transferase [Bacteroidales bacterium]